MVLLIEYLSLSNSNTSYVIINPCVDLQKIREGNYSNTSYVIINRIPMNHLIGDIINSNTSYVIINPFKN